MEHWLTLLISVPVHRKRWDSIKLFSCFLTTSQTWIPFNFIITVFEIIIFLHKDSLSESVKEQAEPSMTFFPNSLLDSYINKTSTKWERQSDAMEIKIHSLCLICDASSRHLQTWYLNVFCFMEFTDQNNNT